MISRKARHLICVVRDMLGNCYEIASFERLDPKSRAEAKKVL